MFCWFIWQISDIGIALTTTSHQQPEVTPVIRRDGKYTSMFRIHRYISKKYRYFYIDVSISIYR
jgi:hypothetical protein